MFGLKQWVANMIIQFSINIYKILYMEVSFGRRKYDKIYTKHVHGNTLGLSDI